MNLQTQLNQQLSALLDTLMHIPESGLEGNAAHYLEKLARVVLNNGADEPMVASLWYGEDFDAVLEEDSEDEDDEGHPPISRDHARAMFAGIDRHHNAEVGINWDVLRDALDDDAYSAAGTAGGEP